VFSLVYCIVVLCCECDCDIVNVTLCVYHSLCTANIAPTPSSAAASQICSGSSICVAGTSTAQPSSSSSAPVQAMDTSLREDDIEDVIDAVSSSGGMFLNIMSNVTRNNY